MKKQYFSPQDYTELASCNYNVYLAYSLVCSTHASPDSLRRLISEFNGRMEQSDGEGLMRFCCKPQPKLMMNRSRFGHDLHYFVTKRQAKMAVLK